MAGFLSPVNSRSQATTYEEMVYRLFEVTPPEGSLTGWAFGKTLVFLGDGPNARASLLTPATYQQQDSQLQDAFNATQFYFDSIFASAARHPATPTTRAGSPAKQPRPDSVHLVVILSDAEQYGEGIQLHRYAEINRVIHRHVERGGQLGVVARVAERYEHGTGSRSGTRLRNRPVFAFIFADTRQSGSVRMVAERLAAPVEGAEATGESRYVMFPASGAPEVQFRVLRGVESRMDTMSTHLWIVPGRDTLRVDARVSLDSVSFTNVAARPRLFVDRCTPRGWQPVPSGPGKVVFGPPRTDSTRPFTFVVPISRKGGDYAGSNLYRVRVHGPAVPDWMDSTFGARSTYEVKNLGRFFAGLGQIENEPTMAAAKFYVQLDGS